MGKGLPRNRAPVWNERLQGKRRTMRYKIVLHLSEEGYSGWIPGLPGCCSRGEAEDEGVSSIRIAAQEYLRALGGTH